jgi:protoheme IX farnesyltransferase
VGLGVWLLASARRLRVEVTSGRLPRPMDLFHVSNSYLALLFVAVVVGVLLRP